ncbi:MAG: UDP-N-acetylmuramoyl-L-alanyl-D-glutamate--2,6-diaminopimelate ligase [Anaerococcus hydrogenalis]|uniref:UDP-N-acetylmuramoyl-L-alanyl-D-glutamate--2, 6-diaminopimelate ligase n=1 Tax=Anaerococcus hydrogenalis TaxID=33029 RepID=UPI002915518A|nr:UDP-N-acetylmuramoyl-L-alanyl-D-glutamate--2,6-diaminopimelate ligase [Anaerococcus hydrogenalis]MDU3688636.1 UDP-N-acetylmuramoyl-L-alanyl-D-glutamate--2,6-diaminopimelate ligase [Anaerococcus hydrogenalis]
MKLEKILKEITYTSKKIQNDKEIVGISSDSRQIKKDYIFLAIKGYEFDGHKYINKAIENGANTVIYTNDDIEFVDDINYIKVEDIRLALAQCSNLLSNYPSKSMRMIGVTGTNGKTTTANLIFFVLNKLGSPCANIGTDGADLITKTMPTEHTTPEITDLNDILTEAIKENIENVVMETSSHGLCLKRNYGIDYEYGVFTNLSMEHMDFHKTMDNYFKAKMILLNNSKKQVVNFDDDYGKRAKEIFKDALTISINEDSDYKAENIKRVDLGLEFAVNKVKFHLNRFGLYDIYNSLCAIAIANDLGYKLEDISKVLEDFKGVKSRFEFIENNLGVNIVVDFAHTPQAFENIFKDLPKDKKTYAVYGITGDRTYDIRKSVGKIAAKYGVFSVITTDDPKFDTFENISNQIKEGVEENKGECIVIKDRKEAIKYAISHAKKGEFVFMLGKGEEDFIKLKGNIKTYYNEKESIREILKEL